MSTFVITLSGDRVTVRTEPSSPSSIPAVAPGRLTSDDFRDRARAATRTSMREALVREADRMDRGGW